VKHRKQPSRASCSPQTECFYSSESHSTSRTIWLLQTTPNSLSACHNRQLYHTWL